jgi:hypothetical protein
MFVDTYLRVFVVGESIGSVSESYADWLIGQGKYEGRRRTRLQEGVHRDWTADRVLSCDALVGDRGCRVDMRRGDGALLVRFIHRDTHDGAIVWTNAARISPNEHGLTLEHAVGRESPRGVALQPVAAPPKVITELFDMTGVEVGPRHLSLPLVRLTEKEVAGYVDQVLLDPQRQSPVVVVSGEDGVRPVVEPEKLAARLRGLATVALLTSSASAFEFTEAMRDRGFGDDFRCFNGAVHAYGAPDSMEGDHRIWLADSLWELPDGQREERLAGLVSGRLAVRAVPPGFFTAIEEHDREERRLLAERLARKPSTPPPPREDVVPREYVEILEAECAALRDALEQSIRTEKSYFGELVEADAGRQSAETRLQDAEARLEQERLVSADLRAQFQQAKQASRAEIPEALLACLRRMIAGKATPEDCLDLVARTFPDRLVVLESARESARRAETFSHCSELLDLLHTLVTGYYEALASGKGDNVAAKVFGKAHFAATESQTVKNNKRAIAERTFVYKNESYVMWSHLKIGYKESPAETIRVHFEWIASEKRIVVGWCGEHRYRV